MSTPRKIELDLILRATGGKCLSHKANAFVGVGTDTRKDLSGQLFVALKGDVYDAHDFVKQAVAAKCAGLLVHRITPELENVLDQTTVIHVPDTLIALQQIAHAQREKFSTKIIGITGSNGKTTSKEFTAAVLSTKFKTHYSKGSFNNHWGVPLTLLAEPADTEVSVVEMGMNHAGELTELVKIATPDVVVCTTVGHAHIEFFGSQAKIAAAKEEIYRASSSRAVMIFNLDNEMTHQMYERCKAGEFAATKVLTFSATDMNANVHLKIDSMSMSALKIQGKIGGVSGKAEVQVFGAQNLTNLMVAASNALAIGMKPEEIWAALPKCKTNWGRNQLVKTKKGAEILFDGYNANPDSMKALIENLTLIQSSGKKIGVFAQMKELGESSPEAHRELGEWVGRAGFDSVWFYGANSEDFRRGTESAGYIKKLMISNDYELSLATEIASVLDKGDVVLVKGSRSMKLERFVQVCDPVDFTLNKE